MLLYELKIDLARCRLKLLFEVTKLELHNRFLFLCLVGLREAADNCEKQYVHDCLIRSHLLSLLRTCRIDL